MSLPIMPYRIRRRLLNIGSVSPSSSRIFTALPIMAGGGVDSVTGMQFGRDSEA